MPVNPFLCALERELTPGVQTEWRPETGSTNDDLKARARREAFRGPVLLTVDRQSAGRGTRGRFWRTAAQPLIFSLGLPLTAPVAAARPGIVCIAAALAVADAASGALGAKVLVKWPNDVWAEGGKAGGILIETVGDAEGRRSLVVGVGLNLAVDAGGRTTAGWPVTALPSRVPLRDPETKGELLALIVNRLIDAFGALRSEEDIVRLTERWPLYDAFFGRTIHWRRIDGSGTAESGVDRGIDAEGRLVLQGRRGEMHALSGELVSLSNGDAQEEWT